MRWLPTSWPWQGLPGAMRIFLWAPAPRGSRGLYRAAKVWAAMEGRDYVTPDDVQYLAVPVLSHRLLLTGQARFSGKSAESVVREVLSSVEVPPRTEEMFRGR